MSAFHSRRTTKPYSRPTNSTAPENGRWEHDLAPGVPNAPKGPAAARNTIASISKGSHTPNNKIVVSNLHYEITPQDLTTIFGQIGTLTKEPVIRYDKSGRSSGVAFITYDSIAEATRAKNQYNGILAKGQPMTVVYDAMPNKRIVSAPSTASLLNRVQKPPLLERLSKDDISLNKTAKPTEPRSVGPIRNRRGGGGAAPQPRRKKPMTADDLDKELDDFMKDDEEKKAAAKAAPAAATDAQTKEADVDMA